MAAVPALSLIHILACGPVSHARNGPPTSWAGWEGWEFWDPLRWAPKIGRCTPNRASKAGTLGVRRVFCPARVRAKNRLDFIPALARAGSLRRWVLLYPDVYKRQIVQLLDLGFLHFETMTVLEIYGVYTPLDNKYSRTLDY